jgi:hypothetical protein
MDQMRERRARLSVILTHAFSEEQGRTLLFGGCYFAGTGANAAREQAFVAGVFRRFPEEQNFVAWTEEALAEEDVYLTWVRRAQVILSILLLGALALAGYYYFFGAAIKLPGR